MFKLNGQEKKCYEFTITISKDEWDNFINEVYEKNKSKYTVQGFRKGKVPRKVIEQNYGATVFFEDAFDNALTFEYHKILDKNKDIQPVASPDIEVKKFDEKGIVVKMKIQSLPEVKLGEYKGLTIESAKGEVDEEKINAEINQIRDRQARFISIQRPAKMGDFVTIDFVGKVDGKEFDGGKAEDYRLELGSHTFIDNFEEQIVNMNIGEKKTIKVTFPKNYTEELKNKPAEFDVILNKVEEKQLPELNDEFASNVSEFENVADFKADIKKHLQESLENKLNRETENKILEAVVKNASVEIPEVMINQQIDAFVKDFEDRLSYQGMKMDDYLKYANTDLENFKKEKREVAEESVKMRLVIEEIIKKENLFATDSELDAKIQEIATKYKKSVEDYKKSMGKSELSYFENGIIMEKLMSFLKSNNTIN